MTIRINLLAEALETEEQRRRDPVKLSVWLGGFFVALALLWSLSLWFNLLFTRSDVGRKRAQWKSIEKGFGELTDQQRQTEEARKKLLALYQLATNRFLFAPPLSALGQCGVNVDGVELAKLKLTLAYTVAEVKNTNAAKVAAAKAAAAGDAFDKSTPASPPAKSAASAKTAVPAKVLRATEKAVLVVEGRDVSDPPGEQVNRYKEALAAFPYFKEHFKSPDSIRLTGLSRQANPAEPSKTHMAFTFECVYPEKVR